MTQRFEVGQWRTSQSGKKFFQRMGSAKQNDDGGFSIWLDALPFPRSDNHPILTVKLERAKVDDEAGRYGSPVNPTYGTTDPNDDIPF